jgi:ribosome-interacting GTPase 1
MKAMLAYTQTIFAPNKFDLPDAADRLALLHELCPLDFPEYVISAEHGHGLDELKNAIYGALGVIRVYTKLPTHKEADFDRPFTLRQGGTVQDVAELVHKDIARSLKHARIWGQSVHDGTVVKGNHVLHDRDIVELHA